MLDWTPITSADIDYLFDKYYREQKTMNKIFSNLEEASKANAGRVTIHYDAIQKQWCAQKDGRVIGYGKKPQLTIAALENGNEVVVLRLYRDGRVVVQNRIKLTLTQ